ncbi:MAG: hypothetical protein HEQ40_03180 [Lacibacter sp.]|jgi:hypothetical protein
MKLEDFINVIEEKKLDSLIITEGLDEIDLSEIIIYMNDAIDLNSEIQFLTIEETDDDLVYEKGNKKLYALFSIEHIVEELYNTLQLKSFSLSKDKAKRLINYAINDA